MSDFYLTLPSNSSMDIHPDNTMANFKTRLPNRVELEGRWEVGMVEIQYPHTWYNLREDEEIIIQPTAMPELNSSFFIPAGFYPTVLHLTDRIEKEICRTLNMTDEKPVIFKYDEIRNKISIRLNRRNTLYFSLAIGEGVRRILGFDSNVIEWGQTEGVLGVDMDPLHSIYVYCDLLEPRVVGDKMVQLLRIVPVEGDHGNMVTRTYENVHYVPIQLNSFEGVVIDIRDSTGAKVPFERGTLNVTLHFRRRQRIV